MQDEQLKTIVELAREQYRLELAIDKMESQLAQLKEKHKNICEKYIPEKMIEIGMDSFKTDRMSLEVKRFYSAHIAEDKKDEAFDWLEKTNNDGIIKTMVTVPFGRGELADARKAVKVLQKAKFIPCLNRSIHAQTLKAFVKEQMEDGKPLPQDLFGVYVGNRTNIKVLEA
jgi:hypothetical protein